MIVAHKATKKRQIVKAKFPRYGLYALVGV